ncbi:MAG: response regulator, partial [Pseudomonadota bacterium]
MALGQNVATNLPFLRRYARALSGSQATGDAFVRATLEAALADEEVKASLEGGRIPLYRAFHKVWASAFLDSDPGGPIDQDTGDHEAGAQARLGAITPLNRQALLLTT